MSAEYVWLSRKEAAARLRELGFPILPGTLARMANRKKGPPYARFGWSRVCYRMDELEEWLRSLTVTVRGSAK